MATTTYAIDNSKLYLTNISSDQIPIIYRDEYNIYLGGIENSLNCNNCYRWRKCRNVIDRLHLLSSQIVSPNEASEDDLRLIHTDRYLNKLESSKTIARIAGINTLSLISNKILNENLLKPFKYQTGGSVLAGKLAMERGWAINPLVGVIPFGIC